MPELRVERDTIAVDSVLAMKPDPKWRYTDKAGHEHRFDNQDSTPTTLVQVEEEPWWCYDCRDLHNEYHLECKLCHETIEPHYVPDPGPHYVMGPWRYYLDNQPISEEEYQTLAAARGS